MVFFLRDPHPLSLGGGGGGTDSFGLGTEWNLLPPILEFLTTFYLPSLNFAPDFYNFSKPLPKMVTSNVKIVPETLDN